MRLFGIETEYGIAREDLATMDPVVESMELVRAYLTAAFELTWDYDGEDPHEDARGFRVTGLQQDREEQEFARKDAHRPFSFYEMDLFVILGTCHAGMADPFAATLKPYDTPLGPAEVDR